MSATTSTAAPFIRPNVQVPAVDSVFRNTDLINFLAANGRVVDAPGSSPFQWNIIDTSNAQAAVYTEGQSLTTFGQQGYVRGSQPAFYVRAAGGQSGHLRDNNRKGGLYEDVRSIEIAKALEDAWKVMEDQLLGSTTDVGISSIIDSGTTYAGVNPAVNTAWASVEQNQGGSLTVTALQDLYEALVNSPNGGQPTHLLMPINQLVNYTNVAGVPGAANSAFRIVPGAQNGAFDAGVVMPLVTFNGLPVVPVRGMTSTELYMVDVSKMDLLIHRQPEVREIARTNDDDLFMVSVAGCLRVTRRKSFAKLTGVTA
jgi:hypothetical protein